MAEHVLKPADAAGSAYSCTICGLSFHPHPPSWLRECPGVPAYPSERIPAYLATKMQLAHDGLRAVGTPAGCYIAHLRQTVVYLFDRGQALPAHEPSTQHHSTLARPTAALQALRTCASCGQVVPTKHDLFDAGEAGRLCGSCYDLWEHEQREGEVYEWAAELLAAAERPNGVPVRILAIETTSPERDAEVLEVAIVDHTGRVVVNSLVQPQQPIPADATAIHGITDADVAEAPTLPEVWSRITTALRRARVVAYDAPFTSGVLNQEAMLHRMMRPACTWDSLGDICMAFSDDGERWLSLAAMCQELGIAAETHQALGDARAALALIHTLAQRASQSSELPQGQDDPVSTSSNRHEAKRGRMRDWPEPAPTRRKR
jgi:DNA polymerase III subunit epsilon